MNRCNKCGAPIMFVQMKSGKYMPVNPGRKPYREGGPEAFVTDTGRVIRGRIPFGNETVDGYGYTPHWATCPAAEEFRRKQ